MSEGEWNRSLLLLQAGDYDRGFPEHGWVRTGRPGQPAGEFERTPDYGMPVWTGRPEPVSLLVNADFGMGDTIHFWRFVPSAAARVARLCLRCDEDFATLFRGVSLVGKDQPVPACDRIIHLMALPRVLGLGRADVAGVPYLSPNPEQPLDAGLAALLGASRFTKVGVCWRGNPFNPRDGVRSVPEPSYRRFLGLFPAGMQFFSLDRVAVPCGHLGLQPYLTDWNQTAHVVSRLDLVITVDTAVAHLAGAVGTPVWLLLGEDADWRWGLGGVRTPWYDSMTLYRGRGDWDGLLARVAADVREKASFLP